MSSLLLGIVIAALLLLADLLTSPRYESV